MFFNKQIANTHQPTKKLDPKQIAIVIGTSHSNIIKYRNQIAKSCETYNPRPAIVGTRRASFCIDDTPTELEIIKNIIFQHNLDAEELTTGMLSKRLNTNTPKIISLKAEIEKLCPSYRAVTIKGNNSFVVQESDLHIIEALLQKEAPKVIPNKPPRLRARELAMAAKEKAKALEEKTSSGE